MSRSQHYRRDQASRKRGDLLTLGYYVGARLVFTLTIRTDGIHVRLTCDPDKVSGADKEEAAWWLNRNYYPRRSHDDVYQLLWRGEPC